MSTSIALIILFLSLNTASGMGDLELTDFNELERERLISSFYTLVTSSYHARLVYEVILSSSVWFSDELLSCNDRDDTTDDSMIVCFGGQRTAPWKLETSVINLLLIFMIFINFWEAIFWLLL